MIKMQFNRTTKGLVRMVMKYLAFPKQIKKTTFVLGDHGPLPPPPPALRWCVINMSKL
jgi:hypothetical protein